jgi:CYTH domain-containing protein
VEAHIEIERKFLVAGDFMQDACDSQHIAQGYLCSSSGSTVRVRLKGDKGYLTIKGPTGKSGMSRYEWEKEIPADEAAQLISLCESGVIDKTRHLVPYGEHTFEVDVFHGDNEGLVIAEVELGSEDEEFQRPVWLGKEVTGDRRYYNSMLIRHPYKMWK